jgi:hypothetical protein
MSYWPVKLRVIDWYLEAEPVLLVKERNHSANNAPTQVPAMQHELKYY